MFTIKTKNEETVFQLENIFETKYKGKMWLIWLALDMSENVNDHPGGDLMKLAGWMQSSLVEIRATSRVDRISSDIGVPLKFSPSLLVWLQNKVGSICTLSNSIFNPPR